MANTERTSSMRWTQWVGVVGVAISALTVAAANVVGWSSYLPGWPGYVAGALAFGFELMAVVLLETIVAHFKAKDVPRIILAILGLVVAVSTNIYGGHRGCILMTKPLFEQAERDREVAQRALDDARGAYWLSEIESVRERIAAVPAPDLSGGPLNDAQENRRWETVTAEDRASLAAAMTRYGNMAIVAELKAPYPAWVPYVVAAVFAFFSVFGLTIFRVKIPGRELVFKAPAKRSRKSRASQDAGVVSHGAENVIEFGTVRDAETVRSLRARGKSFRKIEDETGISKSRANRLIRQTE